MEIRQLTFTRFLAAMTIIVFHYGQSAFPFENGLLQHFEKEGAVAVSYFFCLSGYILAHVYYKTESSSIPKKQFYIKRLARIYPLYLAGFILALLCGMLFYHAFPKGNSILLQALGLQAWVPGICLEINYPGWSLSVELFFYLCFPLLLDFFKRSTTQKIILLTSITWIISAVSHILLKLADRGNSMRYGEFMLYDPLFHINTFIVGIAAAIIVHRQAPDWNNILSNLVFLLSSALLFLIVSTDNIVLPWIHNGLLAPLFVLIIISLQLNKKGISTLFAWKPFVFLGNISYAMYILQHPIRQLFEEALKHAHFNLSATISFYFYVIALILISALAFLGIEKPIRQKITKNYNSTP